MFENDTDIIHLWEFLPLFRIMMMNHFFSGSESSVFNKWNKIIIGFGKMKD